MRFEPRGFSNAGLDASVVSNGTYFTNGAWLPAIGYQPEREAGQCGRARGTWIGAAPNDARDG